MAKPWKLQSRQSAKDGKWYVNLSGGNGETIMRSKGFSTLVMAEALCHGVQFADIEVSTDTKATPLATWFVQPRKGTDGLWYNTLVAPAGEKMWSEGYVRVDSAQRACVKMRDAMVITLDAQAAK